MDNNVIPLFPHRRPFRAPPDPRDKIGLAVRNCLQALAAEAAQAGLPLGSQTIMLAISVLDGELAGTLPGAARTVGRDGSGGSE